MVAKRPVLVIGAGVAGLSTALALAAAGVPVVVVAKTGWTESNSHAAQGGIAAALGPDDSPARHGADTLAVSRGLSHPNRVRILTEAARDRTAPLLASGLLALEADGRPALGLEAGHSLPRILHAAGGLTGRAVTAWLYEDARREAAIRWYDGRVVELGRSGGRVTGALISPAGVGVAEWVPARAVVLATGGFAGLYPVTSNPPGSVGDGLILAWRAGAALADLELVQFHPTLLDDPAHPGILISEAVRGAGAHLVDGAGRRILRAHPAAELAPRDEVARAVEANRPVYLSLAHLDPDRIREEFGALADVLARAGWDLARDRIPVRAGAHFCMGGIVTDEWGAAGLPGLWAVGECAMVGVHGANRLASNSLLEGLVFGSRAAEAILAEDRAPVSAKTFPAPPPEGYWRTPPAIRRHLGDALAVVRSGDAAERIQAVVGDLSASASRDLVVMVAAAARAREESRGAHFRDDFPGTDDRFRGHFVHQRDEGMRFVPWTEFETRTGPAGRKHHVTEVQEG